MFQTTFPQLPEFQGRQVVTLHNQRDFLFFRRHRCVARFPIHKGKQILIPFFFCRYAFRSTEKVALQEIGPRFTLKLRCLKKGIPAVFDFGEEPEPLVLDVPPVLVEEKDQEPSENLDKLSTEPRKTVPPKHDEIIWAWKVRFTLIFSICSYS
jgi:ribosome production factor 1